MYKNKLCPLCPTLLQKLFPFNNEHYSQHAFDQYSIVHFSTGILLSLFIKKLSFVFILSRLFEFFENSKFFVNLNRKLGYKLPEDTLLNSIVDDICVVYGSFIGNKIGFFNSIKFYLFILFIQKGIGYTSGIDIVFEVFSFLFPNAKKNKNKNKNKKIN
jgi:hypothetical protein